MSLVCARILSVCTRMSFIYHSYVLVCHLHVPRIYQYVIVCGLYVLVCHQYVIVCNGMSLVCTRMSSVCHSYVLVCHCYVTRMYSHVIPMSLVCGFTMNHLEILKSSCFNDFNQSKSKLLKTTAVELILRRLRLRGHASSKKCFL